MLVRCKDRADSLSKAFSVNGFCRKFADRSDTMLHDRFLGVSGDEDYPHRGPLRKPKKKANPPVLTDLTACDALETVLAPSLRVSLWMFHSEEAATGA
jgi:hypothetical protein